VDGQYVMAIMEHLVLLVDLLEEQLKMQMLELQVEQHFTSIQCQTLELAPHTTMVDQRAFQPVALVV
jgi:hypothetical protein